MTALQERNCPICDGEAKTALFRRPDGLTVRRCEACNTYYVSPAPSEEALAEFYASYNLNQGFDELSMHELRTLLDGTPPFDDMRLRELSSVMDLPGSSILDVGFGRAGLMYQLKRLGAEVTGVDPDESAQIYARVLGIEGTVHGDVSSLDPNARFDAVILHDVVEHPLDPIALLRACAARLLPGGVLQVWTPNGGCIADSEEPVMLRVDLEHMQYFTTDTCMRVAELLGLRLDHLETVGRFDHPSVHRLQQTQARAGNRRRRIFKRAVTSIPGFARLNALRRGLMRTLHGDGAHVVSVDSRFGSYHLLCLFRKP